MRTKLLATLAILACLLDRPQTLNAADKKPVCDTLRVDLDSGKVNKWRPDASVDSLKKYFPCYLQFTEEGGEDFCGGGLDFENMGLHMYTGLDCFEILPGFKGKLNYQLFGHDEAYLEEVLGQPVRVTDQQDYEDSPITSIYHFKKPYGWLLVWVSPAHEVSRIQVHTRELDKIQWCN